MVINSKKNYLLVYYSIYIIAIMIIYIMINLPTYNNDYFVIFCNKLLHISTYYFQISLIVFIDPLLKIHK